MCLTFGSARVNDVNRRLDYVRRRDNDIKLREATLNDFALLQHWDSQQHNIVSDPNDDWNWETELRRQAGCWHLIVFVMCDTQEHLIRPYQRAVKVTPKQKT